MTSKRRTLGVLAAAIAVAAVAVGASACEFFFSYTKVTAPVGTYGEIGVRVQKTHNNCTLSSMDDYRFAWENVQILGSTEWEEVGPDLYERWFQVSLSEVGEGYLMVSKDCTKEGYQEAVLPITVLDPDEGGIWERASGGAYPLDVASGGTIESVAGPAAYAAGTLSIGGVTVDLPAEIPGDIAEVRLFFTTTGGGDVLPLLVVADGAFVRFDHLIGDPS